MRSRKFIFGLILGIACTVLATRSAGCAAAPVAPTTQGSLTTQPTTAPVVVAQQTPGQVVGGVIQVATTYGPFVTALLQAIPATAGAGSIFAIVLLALKVYEKWFTGANTPTTQAQFLTNLEGFAQDVATGVLTVIPGDGKSAAEVQAIVNVVKAAAASAAAPKTA